MSEPRTCFIVNPQSAGGRTRREWPDMARQLTAALGEVSVRFTQGKGDATHQAREALGEGFELLVAVGGDGTNNEVVNGFFEDDGARISEAAAFAFYPSASGGDMRRTLPTASSIAELITLIQKGSERKVDIGRISLLDADDNDVVRFFLNISSVGISALVNQKVSESSKPFGGTVAFLSATVKSMIEYSNPTVTLTCDDEAPQTAVRYLVAVANGRYFGGGMKIAPAAEIDDGLFDLITLGDLSKKDVIFKGGKLYKGTHLQLKEAASRRVKKVHIESTREIFLDVDGECPGKLPATFEVLPGHLTVRTMPR